MHSEPANSTSPVRRTLTVLQALHRDNPNVGYVPTTMAKTLVRHADGHLEAVFKTEGKPFFVRGHEQPFTDFDSFAALLNHAVESNAAVIHGEIIPGTKKTQMRRLTVAQDNVPATIQDRLCPYIILDIDKLLLPEGVSVQHDADAVVSAARDALPAELRDVSFWFHHSHSAGTTPYVKLHLAFLLREPMSCRDLDRWVRFINEQEGIPLFDPAPYSPNDFIFVGNPILSPGVTDPVPAGKRFGIVRGERDAALLTPASTWKPETQRSNLRQKGDNHIIRGEFGAALCEAGVQQARIERLRGVVRQSDGLAKRLARLVFYSAERMVKRLFGKQIEGDEVPTFHIAEKPRSEAPVLVPTLKAAIASLATYPIATHFDLFSDEDVAVLLGARAKVMLPPVMGAEAIADEASASLFCIGLLRSDSTVRERFPRALSDGIEGDFVAWLRDEGRKALGLTDSAVAAIDQAFRIPPGARARQIFLMRPDLRAAFPLATLPTGWRGFLVWLVENGSKEYCLRPHEIWWFLLECAEDPAREMRLLYLLTPDWQQAFPDATTRFGEVQFGHWICAKYGVDAPWADSSTWPDHPIPGEQIRIAWKARPAWRQRFPEALEQMDQARALLSWLGDFSSGLPEALRAWCAKLEPEATAQEICVRGINVIGHFCYPSGLRTSAQSIVNGLLLADWAVSLRDVPADPRKDEPIHHHFVGLEHYDTTLVHIQPVPYFRDAHVLSGLHPRQPRSYRIGYWYWEMDTVPESWGLAALQTDELWAATDFVGEALAARFDQPVFTLPPGVALAPFQRRARNHFGVPSGKFAFLFVFHMMSIMERKNPLGLIRAFARAFGPGAPVVLVLKVTFGENYPALIDELHRAANEALADVIIIDKIFTQDETLSLMDVCDSYVSLHRSEGLGLTMAEAMLLAKPVIATRYSGNLEFMSDTTSLLVDCKVVEIGRSVGPYEAHMRWAEPSEDHAAQLMRRVFDERDFALALGQRARADLESNFSPLAAGHRMAARLETIRDDQRRWKRAGLEGPNSINSIKAVVERPD